MGLSKTIFVLTVANLMNIIIGSGIMSMPYTMSVFGYGLYSIFLILVYALGLFAIANLLECCEISQQDSYAAIGDKAIGNAGKFFSIFCVFMQTFSAQSSYLMIVKEQLPEVTRTIAVKFGACPDTLPWYTNGKILVLVILFVIIIPLSSLKRIDFLAFTSFIAMACMIVFAIIIAAFGAISECPANKPAITNVTATCNGFENVTRTNAEKDYNKFVSALEIQQENDDCGITFFPATWDTKVLLAVPIMLFAFMCQESFVTLYAQFQKDGSKQEMMNISKIALAIVLLIYWTVAFAGYQTWGSANVSDMLIPYSYNLSGNVWITLARCCSIICVIFSCPLVHFPCRRALLVLVFGSDDFSWPKHLGMMAIIQVCVICVVFFGQSLKQIFTYAGIISSGSLMIILPNLFYYILEGKRTEIIGDYIMGKEETQTRPVNERRRKLSLGIAIFGIAVLLLCFVLQVGQDVGFISA